MLRLACYDTSTDLPTIASIHFHATEHYRHMVELVRSVHTNELYQPVSFYDKLASFDQSNACEQPFGSSMRRQPGSGLTPSNCIHVQLLIAVTAPAL